MRSRKERRMARVVGGQCNGEGGRMRVWNEVSRITGIDWNDCLLQRGNGGLMITLDWIEGGNGLRRRL
mgnify:CR=1 FL=1